MKTLVALAMLCASLAAQETVAPTPERVGEPRGATAGDYNIVQNWELGYRFHTVTGDLGKYRSDVNYGNGIRLLSSRFSVFSRDGHGKWFDEFSLFTQGLGNDPYENATIRFAKNKYFLYDGSWRSNFYYNPALSISSGLHAMDTERRVQDHNFTLFPQSKIRFFAGFTRNVQSGPALTTTNVFDGTAGDEFPLFANVHRRQNEFRFGNELVLLGIKLNWMQSWELYKEDTPTSLSQPSAGANPNDRTTLTSFSAKEPISGTTPSFRLNLFRDKSERWGVNGRFSWSGGRRDFTFDESAVGTSRFGADRNRQVVVSGDAVRPVTTGNLTLSLFPTSTLTITNHTGFHSTRMEGNSIYSEVNNGSALPETINFNYLGIRNITNATSANWQIKSWFTVRGGYQYANRFIRSQQQVTIVGSPAGISTDQTNTLNAGTAGIQLRPLKPLMLAFDGEIGRQDRPFYPTSDKNYHALSARAQWRRGPLTVTGTARSFDNFNSTSLFTYSARARSYSADGSWAPRDWFSLDAGYSRIDSDTVSGIAYFYNAAFIQGESSIFITNLSTGHLGARFSIRQRVDLYAGFTLSRDPGSNQQRPTPTAPAFGPVQVFPFDFDAPLARVSVKLTNRIRWNAGYEYYRYQEQLTPQQNYHAHTGYTSVLWSF